MTHAEYDKVMNEIGGLIRKMLENRAEKHLYSNDWIELKRLHDRLGECIKIRDSVGFDDD